MSNEQRLRGPQTEASLAGRSSRRWTSLLLALTAAIPGCASFQQTASQVTIREPGHRLLGAPEPALAEAQHHLEFAWLAEAAYGKTPHGRQAREQHKRAAAESAVDVPAAMPNCPSSEAALEAAGWTRWSGFPDDGLLKRIEGYHLRIEVWTRHEPAAVAIAFGGTVINNRNDWRANLRWFVPKWLQPGRLDEYSETVQVFAPAFVDEFARRAQSGDPEWEFLRSARLYSVGHSLGGGLAQQFAYALPLDDRVPRVSRVYAFDPSPVTGYYSVDAGVRDVNRKALLIDRVYERGEILAIVRAFTSFFVPPSASDPEIRGVRYALFDSSNPISEHSMTELACRMYEAAGQSRNAASARVHNGPAAQKQTSMPESN